MCLYRKQISKAKLNQTKYYEKQSKDNSRVGERPF